MKLIKVGSSTRTLRAQEILQAGGIKSRLRKQDDASEGCVHALEVSDGQAQAAVTLLGASDIKVKSITGVTR